ncbi:MAG: hypothetical protein ACO1OO_09570 [Flavisolibacter sp.]
MSRSAPSLCAHRSLSVAFLCAPAGGARSRRRSALTIRTPAKAQSGVSLASLTARYAATLQPLLLPAAATLLFAAGAFTLAHAQFTYPNKMSYFNDLNIWMESITSLDKVFKHLRSAKNYRAWSKVRVIKIILGSSVIRVFENGSKPELIQCLDELPVDEATLINDQSSYDEWHFEQVQRVFECLSQRQENTKRLGTAGLLYGHAAKIFNLFIGHLVFYSPYFKPAQVKKLKMFLHVPLDKKVFDALKSFEVADLPATIKTVNKSSYYLLQNTIRQAALRHNLPPIYFDEYGWSYDKEQLLATTTV